jgi:low temperature requirement protein LtrA
VRSQAYASPEDQKVTFIELFFDLVFVFSVTQTVGLLHEGPDLAAIGQVVLIFWLVWWGWTQYTWALNAADTTHPLIEFAMLVTTAIVFFMAVTVPDAFGASALWFAVTYVLVRAIGLGLYALVASENPAQRAAVRTFSLVSVGGLLAVLAGGVAGGELQYLLWGLAIGLDVFAAAIGGQAEGWNLHPEHFAERHGLFVIIALGETLIVAAVGISGATWTSELLAVAIVAVAVTCGLWWTYFTRAKPQLDEALAALRGARQSMLARDMFSLIHFPMIIGVILFAAAIEEATQHPGLPLSLDFRIFLATGTALFVGGMALAVWRATRRLLVPRLVATAIAAAAAIGLAGIPAVATLAIAFAGIAAVGLLEQRPPGHAQ